MTTFEYEYATETARAPRHVARLIRKRQREGWEYVSQAASGGNLFSRYANVITFRRPKTVGGFRKLFFRN